MISFHAIYSFWFGSKYWTNEGRIKSDRDVILLRLMLINEGILSGWVTVEKQKTFEAFWTHQEKRIFESQDDVLKITECEESTKRPNWKTCWLPQHVSIYLNHFTELSNLISYTISKSDFKMTYKFHIWIWRNA